MAMAQTLPSETTLPNFNGFEIKEILKDEPFKCFLQ
jgi:hypothetical protein